ncbi:DUF6056 family protein [uncultured Helicobacter sp.]|uniref:DUF6056 family protein n=1 Tax=uncultured Helicobacter sp. TaxID=175537 RepID=UPI0037518472
MPTHIALRHPRHSLRLCLTDCATLALMLFMLMAFRAFGAIFFWAAGSLNYLWAYCFILLYLLPYRIFWSSPSSSTRFSLLKALGMLILGLVAGWGSELGIVLVVFWRILWVSQRLCRWGYPVGRGCTMESLI